MFAAHVDTVPHEGPIEVVERDGVFRTAGETILGADNKAAVAVLMEMAAIWARGRAPPAGVELLFTVAEEQGLRGAHAYDVSTRCAPSTGFVLDHATPIGEVITAAPTYKKLIADFTGVESHAGLRPEDGRSAIEAASAAIAAMELGRLDAETTANVGVIDGGSAPNVVAGGCRVAAEARAIELGPGRGGADGDGRGLLSGRPASTAATSTCEIDEHFRGYRVKPPRGRWRSPGRRWSAAASSRSSVAPAAAATPTPSACAASTRCCSRTAPRPTTPPTSPSRAPSLDADARRLRCGASPRPRRSAEAAPGPRRRGRSARPSRSTASAAGPGRTSRSSARARSATRSSSTPRRSTSGSAPAASTSSTSTSPAGSRAARAPPGVHVMKLNYTSLQHAVDPVEAAGRAPAAPSRSGPAARPAAARPPGAGRLGVCGRRAERAEPRLRADPGAALPRLALR